MKIKTTDRYNADVDTVFQHLTDPEFLKARAEAIGTRNIDVTVTDKGDTVEIVMKREIPSEAPSALKKFIPEFECTYKPDDRQVIADSWPSSVDDTAAREEWGWDPEFDLDTMSKDMIEKLQKRHADGKLYD